jgi:hypothetical protein
LSAVDANMKRAIEARISWSLSLCLAPKQCAVRQILLHLSLHPLLGCLHTATATHSRTQILSTYEAPLRFVLYLRTYAFTTDEPDPLAH